MPVQPGIAGGPNLPVGVSEEDVGASLRRRFGLQVPLPAPQDPRRPAVAANGAPPGVADPRSPYPIDPATGEALVPPEDQAAGNQPSGQGAPSPLAAPQTKAPPASWSPPPAGNPLLQDIHATGSYLSQGLKDTDVPSWAKPNQFINVIQGDGPMTRMSLGSDDPRYWSARWPGTPENEEVSAAMRNRSALLAALHTLPDMTKLQEARLHVQAQQDLAHNTMVERAAASTADRTGKEQLGAIESQVNAKKLAGALRGNSPTGQPIDMGQAKQDFVDKQDKIGQDLVGIPDAKESEKLKGSLEQAYSMDALLGALSGNSVALRHDPTRAMIAKAIQQQGGKGIPNLGSALEEEIVASLLRAGKFDPVRSQQGTSLPGPVSVTDLTPGAKVMARQVREEGLFSNPRYQVDSPWQTMEFNRPSFRGLLPPTQKDRADSLRRAEVAGELLKLLHQQGYSLR